MANNLWMKAGTDEALKVSQKCRIYTKIKLYTCRPTTASSVSRLNRLSKAVRVKDVEMYPLHNH